VRPALRDGMLLPVFCLFFEKEQKNPPLRAISIQKRLQAAVAPPTAFNACFTKAEKVQNVGKLWVNYSQNPFKYSIVVGKSVFFTGRKYEKKES
jgi:hypothetical protein